MRSIAQQCAVLRSSYWNSAIQLTNVPLYHIRIYVTRSLYFTCPQGLRTDHPVLVYKTCELSGIVLRLFSCLPPTSPTIEPLSPPLFFDETFFWHYYVPAKAQEIKDNLHNGLRVRFLSRFHLSQTQIEVEFNEVRLLSDLEARTRLPQPR